MICTGCGNTTGRIRYLRGREVCTECAGFSVTSSKSDGALTRQRIANQAVKFEGDTLNPWQYSKVDKKFEPNPEFIKRHADNAHNFFKADDVAKSYPKLAQKIQQGFSDSSVPSVDAIGNTNDAFKSVL